MRNSWHDLLLELSMIAIVAIQFKMVWSDWCESNWDNNCNAGVVFRALHPILIDFNIGKGTNHKSHQDDYWHEFVEKSTPRIERKLAPPLPIS